MNEHLRKRVKRLLAQYHQATIATCGPAGPQISIVPYRAMGLHLYLFIAHTSDHLFNLETQPSIVMLTPTWELYGQVKLPGTATAPHEWQVALFVTPTRLNILNTSGHIPLETIDF